MEIHISAIEANHENPDSCYWSKAKKVEAWILWYLYLLNASLHFTLHPVHYHICNNPFGNLGFMIMVSMVELSNIFQPIFVNT